MYIILNLHVNSDDVILSDSKQTIYIIKFINKVQDLEISMFVKYIFLLVFR